MDLQYFGANCILLSNRDVRVVIDDDLAAHGGKTVVKPGDIALFTGDVPSSLPATKITIDRPGEYEVSNISITGIPVRAHMDEVGKYSATMYKVEVGELSFLFTGHAYPELTEDQLETIGLVDVMIVPVGGNGYTLDGVGALKLIKEVEPKLVIPTHYDDKGLKFEVPQQTLEQAIQSLGMEVKETTPKLKLKATDLGDVAGLVVIEKS
ncbi:MAG: MBL fold metallo-hydrolase [Candidatus Saccharimonadales bacterium]